MNEKTTWEWDMIDKSDQTFKKVEGKFDTLEKDAKKLDHIDPFAKWNTSMGVFHAKSKEAFNDIKREIPLLGRAVDLISNPLVLATVGVLAIGSAFSHGIKEAKAFKNEFLELEQLNLNKSKDQIKSLERSVLNVSFEKALDPTKVNRAFFDVQSATGKYGREVEKFVARTGEFATATKSDFNKTVEGAAKASGIFHVQNSELDKFLQSSAKTVQVGITTFDQLARVQVEYAGAAAAANQGFDEGNKLFAAFSKNAKSVDIAANLTKTAFQDLGKAQTIKGLKAINVDLFDTEGNMKKIDKIAGELVPIFDTLSDKDFAKLKENIGGSEGLRALLDQLKTAGDDVLNTFNEFDNTNFDIDAALNNAKNDMAIMDDMLNNKLKTSWIRLGDTVAPWWVNVKESMISIVDSLDVALRTYNAVFKPVEARDAERERASREQEDRMLNMFDSSDKPFNDLGEKEKKNVMAFLDRMEDKFLKESFGETGESAMGRAIAAGRASGVHNAKLALQGLLAGGTNDALDDDTKNKPKPDLTGLGLDIAGGGNKKIIVNINSLVNDLRYTVMKENKEMSDKELEEKIVELLIRSVRQAESVI